jgi:hypothetical protein
LFTELIAHSQRLSQFELNKNNSRTVFALTQDIKVNSYL